MCSVKVKKGLQFLITISGRFYYPWSNWAAGTKCFVSFYNSKLWSYAGLKVWEPLTLFWALDDNVLFDVDAKDTSMTSVWLWRHLLAPLTNNLELKKNKALNNNWKVLCYLFDLVQGSQTRVPRAECGTSDVFVRPTNIPKNGKVLIKFSLFWGLFMKIVARRSLFSYKLQPAEHYFFWNVALQ